MRLKLGQDRVGLSRNRVQVDTYHVCAFGRLSIGWSTRCMVNSLGPAAPVEPGGGGGGGGELTSTHTLTAESAVRTNPAEP